MLQITIQGDDATALAAARGVLKRFAAEVTVNGQPAGSLADVLTAEGEARGKDARTDGQRRVLKAKAGVRAAQARLRAAMQAGGNTEEAENDVRAAIAILEAAKAARGPRRGASVEIPPADLGLST